MIVARTATIARTTAETDIRVTLDLDGTGKVQAATGIGFLDHMLTHLAVHGLFDLTVQAKGDLHIDVHHTVEDVALALGQAFDQALGDRKGIVRMASFYAPMDETLAFVALDLSGRPYSVIDAEWGSAPVGQMRAQVPQAEQFSSAVNRAKDNSEKGTAALLIEKCFRTFTKRRRSREGDFVTTA